MKQGETESLPEVWEMEGRGVIYRLALLIRFFLCFLSLIPL